MVSGGDCSITFQTKRDRKTNQRLQTGPLEYTSSARQSHTAGRTPGHEPIELEPTARARALARMSLQPWNTEATQVSGFFKMCYVPTFE